MPLDTNGNYVSPTWVNVNEPAIDAEELNAMSGAIAGAVEYDREMTLNDDQQTTARGNIGAAAENDLSAALTDIDSLRTTLAALQSAVSSLQSDVNNIKYYIFGSDGVQL